MAKKRVKKLPIAKTGNPKESNLKTMTYKINKQKINQVKQQEILAADYQMKQTLCFVWNVSLKYLECNPNASVMDIMKNVVTKYRSEFLPNTNGRGSLLDEHGQKIINPDYKPFLNGQVIGRPSIYAVVTELVQNWQEYQIVQNQLNKMLANGDVINYQKMLENHFNAGGKQITFARPSYRRVANDDKALGLHNHVIFMQNTTSRITDGVKVISYALDVDYQRKLIKIPFYGCFPVKKLPVKNIQAKDIKKIYFYIDPLTNDWYLKMTYAAKPRVKSKVNYVHAQINEHGVIDNTNLSWCAIDMNSANNELFAIVDQHDNYQVRDFNDIAAKMIDLEAQRRQLQSEIKVLKNNHKIVTKQKQLVLRQITNRKLNIFNNWLKEQIAELSSMYDVVIIEDLTINDLKATNNSGWNYRLGVIKPHEIKQLFASAAKKHGNKLAMVSPRYTSKACQCGIIHHDLKVGVKDWQCPTCHTINNRDKNACYNIKKVFDGVNLYEQHLALSTATN